MDRRELFNLPNCLTLSRIVLTPLFLGLLFADLWYWKALAFAVFGAAALTDFYDGRLARAGNRVTALGRFLDPLADKVLVTSALVAFALGRVVHFWLVVPIVVRDVAITVLRLHGMYRGRQMVTSRLAKWKTAFQLSAVALLLLAVALQEVLARFRPGSAATDGAWVAVLGNGLMGAVLLLTLASGLHYLFRASFIYPRS
jgi:CDP-diacylglycerol--glycerol-3-phosphate 3-phosphatidyltransferase